MKGFLHLALIQIVLKVTSVFLQMSAVIYIICERETNMLNQKYSEVAGGYEMVRHKTGHIYALDMYYMTYVLHT